MDEQKDSEEKDLLLPLYEDSINHNDSDEEKWNKKLPKRTKRSAKQLGKHCFCFIPYPKVPRFTLVKIVLVLALFAFFALLVLHYDYGYVARKELVDFYL